MKDLIDRCISINCPQNLRIFLSKFIYLLILAKLNISIIFFIVNTKKPCFVNFFLFFIIKTWSQLFK